MLHRSLGPTPRYKLVLEVKTMVKGGTASLLVLGIIAEGGADLGMARHHPSPGSAVCQVGAHLTHRGNVSHAHHGVQKQADSRRRHSGEQPGQGLPRSLGWGVHRKPISMIKGSRVEVPTSRSGSLGGPDPGGRIVICLLCGPLREPSLRNEQRAWIDAWRWCHDPRLDLSRSHSPGQWAGLPSWRASSRSTAHHSLARSYEHQWRQREGLDP